MKSQSTQASPRPGICGTRHTQISVLIVLLATAAVGIVAFLESQRSPVVRPVAPVVPQPASPPVQKVDYQALVKQKTNEAGRQDRAAHKRFEHSLSEVIAYYEPRFAEAASKSSEQAAKPKAMGAIVYYLAKDQIYKKRETDAYLTQTLEPDLNRIVDPFARDVKKVIDRFEYDLRGISVKLAIDLASIGPGASPASQQPIPRFDTWREFDKSLKDLGYEVGVISASTVFIARDSAASRIATNILKDITAISSRMFAKPIAKAASSSALAALDGPLPFGDIVSLIGILWTGYDISQMQSQFQEDVRASTKIKLDGISDAMNRRARTFAANKITEFKNLQEEMGNQTKKQFEVKAGS